MKNPLILKVVICLLSIIAIVLLNGCPQVCAPFNKNSGTDSSRDTAMLLTTQGGAVEDRIDACDGDNTDWKYILVPDSGNVTIKISLDNPKLQAKMTFHEAFGRQLEQRATVGGVTYYEFTKIPVEKGKYFFRIQADKGGGVYSVGATFASLDADRDTITDVEDNCPTVANKNQLDTDRDGLGDVCDEDIDGDHINNKSDNAPRVPNPDQLDTDGDKLGDVIDGDIDGDGILNIEDNKPLVHNPNQGNSRPTNNTNNNQGNGTVTVTAPDNTPVNTENTGTVTVETGTNPDEDPELDPLGPRTVSTIILLVTPSEGKTKVRISGGKNKGLKRSLKGKIKGTNKYLKLTTCGDNMCEGTTDATKKELRDADNVIFTLK